MNMSREGQAMCFAGPIQFCRWQTTDHSNPDVNDDMEMFEMLGLTPQNHLQKFLSYYSWSCELSIYHLEKTKMVKTGHTIDRIWSQLKKKK
jgi:biotin synthase